MLFLYVSLSSKLLEGDCIPVPINAISFFVNPILWRSGVKLFAGSSSEVGARHTVGVDRFKVVKLLLQMRLDGVQFY